MKRLLLITGVILISYVVFSSVITTPKNDTVAVAQEVETKAEERARAPMVYTVKSENNRVVVYLDDAIYLKTTTVVSSLPKADQKRLLYGIKLNTKEELKTMLEDFCS